MIEWARRRRSYYYLGCNWALEFVTGTVAGVVRAYVVEYFSKHESLSGQVHLGIALILLFGVWAGAAWYLAQKMKSQADNMELAWSCGRLYPDFKNKVFWEQV